MFDHRLVLSFKYIPLRLAMNGYIMDVIYNMNWPRRGDDETQITHAESLLRKKKFLKKKEVEL